MLLEIVVPSGVVWKGEAEQVRIPSANGEMGVLPGHTPLMAALKSGFVVVDTRDGNTLGFAVKRGLATVASAHIYVVVESADQETV